MQKSKDDRHTYSKYTNASVFRCQPDDLPLVQKQLQSSTRMALPENNNKGKDGTTVTFKAYYYTQGNKFHLLLTNDDRRKLLHDTVTYLGS